MGFSNDEKKLGPDERNEAIRSRFIPIMAPLFYPTDPFSNDIVEYFSALLRVVGLEDKGWDPYLESRAMLDDLYTFMQMDFSDKNFTNDEFTKWRLGLLFYNHIIEMDAPYEVLSNLLRFRLGKKYSPNPFYEFLNSSERKRFRSNGLFPAQKIKILKQLSKEENLQIGEIFDEFYRADLRNAISHSDFIFTDEGFRCRNGNGANAFEISFEELDALLTKAKIFIGTFFGLEKDCRHYWGSKFANKGVPYDPNYKGIMEVLADDEGIMNGFKVHWPNMTDSTYRRTADGIDMTNCSWGKDLNIELFVGRYARNPSRFSPLVEANELPRYTRISNSDQELNWPT